jgi:hypothetical protein
MVAGILQEQDLAVTEAGDCGLHCRADAVVGCLYGLAEDLGEAVANGCHAAGRSRALLIGVALRAAKVGAEDHLRTVVQQVLDGWHAGSDASVVGDGAGRFVERDVEVGAEEHSLALEFAT